MPPKAKGDDAKMADAEKKVRDCRSSRGWRRVASLQRDCLRAVLFILSDCHALAASGRGATRARRAHSNIQKCRAHRCWPRSCVSMRQAVDAAKDKANEEMPVDPVVAAMTGEFLRPIPRVVSSAARLLLPRTGVPGLRASACVHARELTVLACAGAEGGVGRSRKGAG